MCKVLFHAPHLPFAVFWICPISLLRQKTFVTLSDTKKNKPDTNPTFLSKKKKITKTQHLSFPLPVSAFTGAQCGGAHTGQVQWLLFSEVPMTEKLSLPQRTVPLACGRVYAACTKKTHGEILRTVFSFQTVTGCFTSCSQKA